MPDDFDRAAKIELAHRERSLSAALHRPADSAEQTCIDCREEITPARRLAVPWATRCFDCQRDAERFRR